MGVSDKIWKHEATWWSRVFASIAKTVSDMFTNNLYNPKTRKLLLIIICHRAPTLMMPSDTRLTEACDHSKNRPLTMNRVSSCVF
jgi:hypothetical protein